MEKIPEPSYEHWLNYIFIAEFHPTTSAGLVREPTLTEKHLSLGSPYGHIIKGRMMDCSYFMTADGSKVVAQLQVVFNSELRSWDYSWRSNRWSGKHETHVLEVAVLKRNQDSQYQNLLQECCAPFQVISSKKQAQARKAGLEQEEDVTPRSIVPYTSEMYDETRQSIKRKQGEDGDLGLNGDEASKRSMVGIPSHILPYGDKMSYVVAESSRVSAVPKAQTSQHHLQLHHKFAPHHQMHHSQPQQGPSPQLHQSFPAQQRQLAPPHQSFSHQQHVSLQQQAMTSSFINSAYTSHREGRTAAAPPPLFSRGSGPIPAASMADHEFGDANPSGNVFHKLLNGNSLSTGSSNGPSNGSSSMLPFTGYDSVLSSIRARPNSHLNSNGTFVAGNSGRDSHFPVSAQPHVDAIRDLRGTAYGSSFDGFHGYPANRMGGGHVNDFRSASQNYAGNPPNEDSLEDDARSLTMFSQSLSHICDPASYSYDQERYLNRCAALANSQALQMAVNSMHPPPKYPASMRMERFGDYEPNSMFRTSTDPVLKGLIQQNHGDSHAMHDSGRVYMRDMQLQTREPQNSHNSQQSYNFTASNCALPSDTKKPGGHEASLRPANLGASNSDNEVNGAEVPSMPAPITVDAGAKGAAATDVSGNFNNDKNSVQRVNALDQRMNSSSVLSCGAI
jgi:hypothetical protein